MPEPSSRSPRTVRNLHAMSGRAPTAQRMKFGEMLRQHRVRLGLTEKEVAQRLGGRSASKISRLESGEHDFKESDVRSLLDVYGVEDPAERERMLELAHEANQKGWWEPYSDVATKELQTYVSLEDIAQRMRSFETGQLHGLLQIPDYTRALVRANSPHLDAKSVERITELRRLRAERFLQDSSAELKCVLDEVTLSRGYGSDSIMQQQVEHLISLADHPRLTFRLIPTRGLNLPVQIGPTTIFDFAAGQLPAIVYAERIDGGLYLQDPAAVDRYAKAFDHLLVKAKPPARYLQKLKDYSKLYGG